ncbi:MAG: helix-turn-helix domain-containing protein [Nitrosomonadaceae bacterium]|nr:MAG: helix-turn-helix domain-containing protein [Nitrosomonadaceae bacterium]
MDATDNNDNGVAETEVAETQQSVGQLLQAARLMRGLGIEDVARHLRLSVRQVTALEEDDYAKLSGGTFLRGFVRNYAKLVQLDATPLLLLLQQVLPPAHQVIAPRTEGIPFPSDQKSVGRSLIIAGVVVVALLFLIYEIYQGNETVPQPAVQVATKAEAENEPAVAQAQSELSPTTLSDADPVQAVQEVAVVQQGNNNLPAPQRQQVAAVVAAPDLVNKGEGVLRFAFAQESWVEINDGAGRMIFSQLNPAGSEQVIRGKMPLSVVIGNAANVKLVYNNKPVNLAPHTNTNTNGGVARLSLE